MVLGFHKIEEKMAALGRNYKVEDHVSSYIR